MTQAIPVLVLVRDLIFATKITSTAQSLGVPVRVVREPTRLLGEPGCLLIVDLNLLGATEAAAAWQAAQAAPTVGFVSHVDATAIAQARSAGIERILARSQFVQVLPQLLLSQGAAKEGAS